MVRTGQAFAYRRYLTKCEAGAYLGAEGAAETDRLGIWSAPGGITRRETGGTAGEAEGPPPADQLAPPPWESCNPSPIRLVAVTAARRSAASPRPRNCCGRATPTWIAMAMGWLANRCADLMPEPDLLHAQLAQMPQRLEVIGRGDQPGHSRFGPELLPIERLDELVEHRSAFSPSPTTSGGAGEWGLRWRGISIEAPDG